MRDKELEALSEWGKKKYEEYNMKDGSDYGEDSRNHEIGCAYRDMAFKLHNILRGGTDKDGDAYKYSRETGNVLEEYVIDSYATLDLAGISKKYRKLDAVLVLHTSSYLLLSHGLRERIRHTEQAIGHGLPICGYFQQSSIWLNLQYHRYARLGIEKQDAIRADYKSLKEALVAGVRIEKL